MRSSLNKNILIGLFLVLLTLPAIQNSFKLYKEKPLQGAYNTLKDTVFTFDGWFSGRYQLIHEQYRNEKFGFRNFFVRLNNQVAFNLYNIAKANGVIIGKDRVLFQTGYIDSYFGNDFVGEDSLKKQITKFKVVQDALLERGKYLLFVFAPGKGSVFSEYIPEKYFHEIKKTNYQVISGEFEKQDVKFIDFKKYFTEKRNDFEYPIFPKCGTHWSGYVATLVMDSLVKYFEKISAIDFIDFKSTEGYSTKDDMRYTDSDIGDAMNLLFPIKNWKMYYPRVVFENQPDKTKPNFLFIGDSFTQSLYKFYPYFTMLFGDRSAFWGGNNLIYWPDSLEKQYIKVRELNQYDEIMKRDFIVIVCTEINLSNFTFDFIESAYNIFGNKDSISYWETVKIKEDEIRNNTEFYKLVIKQAQERNISVERNVTINAKFILDNELKDRARTAEKL